MPRLLNSSEAIFTFVNCENTTEESQMLSQSVGPNHSQSSLSTELLPETKGRDFPEKEICPDSRLVHEGFETRLY